MMKVLCEWPCWLRCACLLGVVALRPCDVTAASASAPGTKLPMQVTVDLGFSISIDAYIFFGVGDGAASAAPGGTIASVNFNVMPSPSGVPLSPGNNRSASWDSFAPPLTVTPTSNVLPVTVRSNAGQIVLRASLDPSAVNTLPMSQISAISDLPSALPAPPLSTLAIGASSTAVNVQASGALTSQSTNWTFNYANTAKLAAGTYTAQVIFTASTL